MTDRQRFWRRVFLWAVALDAVGLALVFLYASLAGS